MSKLMSCTNTRIYPPVPPKLSEPFLEAWTRLLDRIRLSRVELLHTPRTYLSPECLDASIGQSGWGCAMAKKFSVTSIIGKTEGSSKAKACHCSPRHILINRKMFWILQKRYDIINFNGISSYFKIVYPAEAAYHENFVRQCIKLLKNRGRIQFLIMGEASHVSERGAEKRRTELQKRIEGSFRSMGFMLSISAGELAFIQRLRTEKHLSTKVCEISMDFISVDLINLLSEYLPPFEIPEVLNFLREYKCLVGYSRISR